MKTRILKVIGFFLTGTLLLTYCKKDDSGQDTEAQFTKVVESGGIYENPTSTGIDSASTTTSDSTIEDGYWKCTTTSYDITEGNERQPLFNADASVIYPGSLLQGKSLNQSTPDVIAVDRAGGTISFNLNNGDTTIVTVDEVTKSSISKAMGTIISNSNNIVPANFVFSYSEVQSEEELAIKLGIDVNTTFVDVKADMALDFSKTCNRILVKLSQQYYTMSFDLPTSYDKLFASTVTATDLAKYVGAGNPATYISDVTYGRIFYMLFESTSSAKEMKTAISGSFSGISSEVSYTGDVSSIKKLSDLSVKVIAFGGDAKGTMNMMGETDISTIAERMASSTDIKTGLPLSYVVRNVYDNQIVKVKLTSQYDVTNCVQQGIYMVDNDGNKYKADTIGSQIWTLENLKTTTYNDGAVIPLITDSVQWRNTGSHGYCYNSNKKENLDTYGCLYNWWAVSSGKLAPKGWHVATEDEWKTLINYMGGYDVAGGYMKDTTLWQTPNSGASNVKGFKILPGGIREWDGSWVVPGTEAYFWTNKYYDKHDCSIFIETWYNSTAARVNCSYFQSGFYVRCIKD
jgi:uncharacterized protein (TIGR02145 family)